MDKHILPAMQCTHTHDAEARATTQAVGAAVCGRTSDACPQRLVRGATAWSRVARAADNPTNGVGENRQTLQRSDTRGSMAAVRLALSAAHTLPRVAGVHVLPPAAAPRAGHMAGVLCSGWAPQYPSRNESLSHTHERTRPGPRQLQGTAQGQYPALLPAHTCAHSRTHTTTHYWGAKQATRQLFRAANSNGAQHLQRSNQQHTGAAARSAQRRSAASRHTR
jgi:hypothetical protein